MELDTTSKLRCVFQWFLAGLVVFQATALTYLFETGRLMVRQWSSDELPAPIYVYDTAQWAVVVSVGLALGWVITHPTGISLAVASIVYLVGFVFLMSEGLNVFLYPYWWLTGAIPLLVWWLYQLRGFAHEEVIAIDRQPSYDG